MGVLPMGLTIGNSAPTTRKVFLMRSLRAVGMIVTSMVCAALVGMSFLEGVRVDLGPEMSAECVEVLVVAVIRRFE